MGLRAGWGRAIAAEDGRVEKVGSVVTASWRPGMGTGARGTWAGGTLVRHLGPSQGAPGRAQLVPLSSAISRIWSVAEARRAPATGAGWEHPEATADGVADVQATSDASRGASRRSERNAHGNVMESGRSGIAQGPPSWRDHELS